MQVCFQEAVKRGFCNSQCNVLNKLHNNRLERWIWVSGLEPLVRFKTDVDMVNLIIFISMPDINIYTLDMTPSNTHSSIVLGYYELYCTLHIAHNAHIY